jgi:site-specific recombinase XerD
MATVSIMPDLTPDPKPRKSPSRKLIKPIRTSKLEPKLDPKSKGKQWRLSVPANRSRTGKRQNLYFETKLEAENEAALIERLNRTHGQLLRDIPAHDLFEASKALELLRPLRIGLLEAVTGFVADHQRRSESKTFGQAFDAYEGMRDDRTYDYRKEIEHTRVAVSHLLSRPVIDIRAEDLEHSLSSFARSTRDARVRRLRSVFNEAVRQGWVTHNPADRLNITTRRRDEVRIYTVADAEELLRRAMADDRALVPFLAIGLFCGLRPENELQNLLWSDVHLADANPQIVIRPETSKTRRRRFVDVSANCVAWIEASGVKCEGRVVPFSAMTLKRKRKRLCAAQEEPKRPAVEWIPDGMRHTYCSAHFKHYKDVGKLLLQTGHTNTATLSRYYHRSMPAVEAAKFWAI